MYLLRFDRFRVLVLFCILIIPVKRLAAALSASSPSSIASASTVASNDEHVYHIPNIAPVTSSPADFKGADINSPVYTPSSSRKPIVGTCTVYANPEDTLGYPCPSFIKIEIYDDEGHWVKSVQTKSNGTFGLIVDVDKVYRLKLISDQFAIKKTFDSRVRSGNVHLPLELTSPLKHP